MSERPSGTVTFLTTDIEGSTRLWQTHHEAMKTALADHDRLVRTAIETHGGYVFSTAGDSFWAAFTHPVDAALAALDTHQAIATHDWGDIGDLKVRAALDTGLADERDGDYFGPPLNRASRIMKHAHGGETLCSHTTADLLKHDLPIGYAVAKVGRRRLRDVEEVETLYRITTTGDTTRHTRWIPAAAVVAVVAAVGVGWWATSGGDGTPTDNTTTAAAPTTTEIPSSGDDDPADGVLWSVPVGDIAAGPLILGDIVVTATNNSVSTFDLASGNLLWELDGFDRVRTLTSDGDYLFVTSIDRLDVIHPTSGKLIPRCGFRLPLTFARTNVTEGDIHIMTGSLYRVVTNPGGQRCHGPVIENAGTMSGLDPTAGPVHTGRVVLAADAVGVYAFDPATLDLLWRYPDRSEPAIPVHPPSLVAADYEQRVRTGVTASTRVALTDESGILVVLEATADGARPVPLPVIRTNPDRPIVITGHAIVAVNARNQLIGIDPDSGEIAWTIEEVEVTAGPLQAGSWVLIATTSEVRALDPIDGSQIHSTHTPVAPAMLVTTGSTALVVDADHTMHALPIAWATAAPDWRPPPDPTPSPEPETTARNFIDAWNGGDRETVERLMGVDVSVLVTGLREIWTTRAQQMLWTWFAGDQVMQAEWALHSCTTRLDNPTTTVTCSSTYTDALVEAAEATLDEFATQITVTNGVVTKIIAGGNISRPGEGGVFTDFGGRWVHYDQFDHWASEQHPTEFAQACRTADGMGPECAQFTVAHLEEWAATLDS